MANEREAGRSSAHRVVERVGLAGKTPGSAEGEDVPLTPTAPDQHAPTPGTAEGELEPRPPRRTPDPMYR